MSGIRALTGLSQMDLGAISTISESMEKMLSMNQKTDFSKHQICCDLDCGPLSLHNCEKQISFAYEQINL
jgi:hypothetical protein